MLYFQFQWSYIARDGHDLINYNCYALNPMALFFPGHLHIISLIWIYNTIFAFPCLYFCPQVTAQEAHSKEQLWARQPAFQK